VRELDGDARRASRLDDDPPSGDREGETHVAFVRHTELDVAGTGRGGKRAPTVGQTNRDAYRIRRRSRLQRSHGREREPGRREVRERPPSPQANETTKSHL
jgi:hypothetical protein